MRWWCVLGMRYQYSTKYTCLSQDFPEDGQSRDAARIQREADLSLRLKPSLVVVDLIFFFLLMKIDFVCVCVCL